MGEKHRAETGLSYKSGGEWKIAHAGEVIDIDADQVKSALERGVIKAVASQIKTPLQSKKEVAT